MRLWAGASRGSRKTPHMVFWPGCCRFVKPRASDQSVAPQRARHEIRRQHVHLLKQAEEVDVVISFNKNVVIEPRKYLSGEGRFLAALPSGGLKCDVHLRPFALFAEVIYRATCDVALRMKRRRKARKFLGGHLRFIRQSANLNIGPHPCRDNADVFLDPN